MSQHIIDELTRQEGFLKRGDEKMKIERIDFVGVMGDDMPSVNVYLAS